MNKIQSAALKWLGLSYLVDAANWTQRWRRPLEPLTTNTIGIEVNDTDWAILLSDSRKLYCNLGPAKAAIDDKATYTVGRAWTAKSFAKDRDWAKKAERWVNEIWYPTADIRGGNFDFKTDLWLLSQSIDRDGEIYPLLTESPDGWPQIQLIPAHMIGGRDVLQTVVESGPYKGMKIRQGIVFNDNGRAVAFSVLGANEGEDQFYSARDMMQIYDPQWVDQVRGFPAFSAAILDLKDLRTIQGYEKIAAMLMSSIGLIEDNELGAPDPNDPGRMLTKQKTPALGPDLGLPTVTTEAATGVTTRYFRAGTGSKLSQIKSDRPGDAVSKFMDRLIRNACCGAGWSYELTWDSSQLGGANIRLAVAKAMRSVEDRQDLLKPFARRAVGYAVAKAIKLGQLPSNDEWFNWGFSMPAKMTVDYGRDSKADRDDYSSGLNSMGRILEEQGLSFDEYVLQLQEERRRLIEAGIPVPTSFPGMAPQPTALPTDEDEKKILPMR